MPSLELLQQGFRLGEWLVKPNENSLVGTDAEIHLEPRVMDTLLHLAGSRGEVVSRQELVDAVWQQVVVNDEALTRTISELRTALGDDAHRQRYVRTVPKRGYALRAPVEQLSVEVSGDSAGDAVPSLAVLPFNELDSSADHPGFAEGLTEELICALGQLRGLRVAASRSVFAVRETLTDAVEIAAALGVQHLLEGSVRINGDRVRVTTQLVRASDGFQEWASSFDRTLEDIFAIQEDIARNVMDALRLNFRLGRQPSIVTVQTRNMRAYELFLQARLRYQTEQHGLRFEGLAEAEEATSLVPDYAEALGLAALIRTLNSTNESYFMNAAEIRRCYEAALAANPFQEEALMAKAFAVRWASWDWAAVKLQFERALAVSPNCPDIHIKFATHYYRDLGEHTTAELLFRRAMMLDPLSARPHSSLGYNMRYQRRPEEALEQFNRALAINPDHGYARLGKLVVLLDLKRFAEADALVREVEVNAGPADLLALNCRTRLHAARGGEDEARPWIHRVRELSRQPGGDRFLPLVGWAELMLGDIETGMQWLDHSLERQISQVLNARAFIKLLPTAGVLERPEVQAFLRKMHLDDASIQSLRAGGHLDLPCCFDPSVGEINGLSTRNIH